MPVAIGRGENHGHKLTYHNVVRRWMKLGDWTGQAATFRMPVTGLADTDFSLKDVDHLAVIVQSGAATKPGLMLGAAIVACADFSSRRHDTKKIGPATNRPEDLGD